MELCASSWQLLDRWASALVRSGGISHRSRSGSQSRRSVTPWPKCQAPCSTGVIVVPDGFLSGARLTKDEVELLIDGSSDEVDFIWTLFHLDIFENPPLRPGPPTQAEIDRAFESIERLVSFGYIIVGRSEYIDGGPPGRAAPVTVVSEPIGIVKSRVERACAEARAHPTGSDDWQWSCWLTCTDSGRSIAGEALKPENKDMRRWFLGQSGWTRTSSDEV